MSGGVALAPGAIVLAVPVAALEPSASDDAAGGVALAPGVNAVAASGDPALVPSALIQAAGGVAAGGVAPVPGVSGIVAGGAAPAPGGIVVAASGTALALGGWCCGRGDRGRRAVVTAAMEIALVPPAVRQMSEGTHWWPPDPSGAKFLIERRRPWREQRACPSGGVPSRRRAAPARAPREDATRTWAPSSGAVSAVGHLRPAPRTGSPSTCRRRSSARGGSSSTRCPPRRRTSDSRSTDSTASAPPPAMLTLIAEATRSNCSEVPYTQRGACEVRAGSSTAAPVRVRMSRSNAADAASRCPRPPELHCKSAQYLGPRP